MPPRKRRAAKKAGRKSRKGVSRGRTKSLELQFSDEQLKEISKVFGPAVAKRLESVIVEKRGTGLQSILMVN